MKAIISLKRIIYYAIICYASMLIVSLPIFLIPDYFYPNLLVLILIKQSIFLLSGLFIIMISIHYSINATINFNFSKVVFYYIFTILIVILFCWILSLFKIVNVHIFYLTDLSSFGKFLTYCIIPTLFIGFGEEFIFRWFLFNKLKTFLSTNSAIIISSLIFTIGHKWNMINMLSAFTAGCLFAIIYNRTNSIFITVSIHAAWDFGQRFFFSGMSEYSYKTERLILLSTKDIGMYNLAELILWISVLYLIVGYYIYKDRKYIIFEKA